MSLRSRLLVALGAVALVALIGADIATYSALQSFLLQRVDQQLDAAHGPVESALLPQGGGPPGGPGGDGGGGPGGGDQNLEHLAAADFVELRSASGAVLTTLDYYQPGGKEWAPRLPADITGFTSNSNPGQEPTAHFDAASTQAGGPRFRVAAYREQNWDVLVIAIPLSDSQATLRHLLDVELAVTGAALALAALLGWWLVRLGLRPLSDIERTAETITNAGLGHRVPGEAKNTEVGRLARVLNVMLSRIEGAFAARDATENDLRRSQRALQQFVSDASHELRTPLAAVSAYAELFERGADRRPEDLERVMSGIRSETARMGGLVDDLLLLARMDEGRPLDRAPVELVGLASEAVAAARAVGPNWPVAMDATEPVEVRGDRARLRQVLDNLLSNVRAHTPEGTQAMVRVRRHADEAEVQVTDNGPGIAADDADRLFERFYRSDSSRSRSSGGSGLGLSIVGAIVAAHGGSASARPGDAGGSVFTVRIPLDPADVENGGPEGE